MDTEKVVVILLVISILFSAFAILLNIGVVNGINDGPLMIGGGTNTNTIIRTTIGEPAGGQIGLNIIKGGP